MILTITLHYSVLIVNFKCILQLHQQCNARFVARMDFAMDLMTMEKLRTALLIMHAFMSLKVNPCPNSPNKHSFMKCDENVFQRNMVQELRLNTSGTAVWTLEQKPVFQKTLMRYHIIFLKCCIERNDHYLTLSEIHLCLYLY